MKRKIEGIIVFLSLQALFAAVFLVKIGARVWMMIRGRRD